MIDFGPPLDITPVSTAPHYQEYQDKGRTRLGWEVSPSPTHMVSQAVPLGQFEISSTPTQFELLQEQQQLAEDQREQKDWPELNKISDTRIRLLVEKYEGEATSEDSARLDILTERLRRFSALESPQMILTDLLQWSTT